MSNSKFSYDNMQNMSDKDKRAIELLKLLLGANVISIVSDLLSTSATINGIKSIEKKYVNSNENIYSPDALALYSIYLGVISRILVAKVGLAKTEIAYKSYIDGDKSVNLNNFYKINTANGVLLLGILIALEVAENIYDGNRLNIFI